MFVNIAVDVILTAIIIVGAVIGAKCGFVKIISKPVAFFGSLAIAFGFSDDFAAALIEPRIYNPVSAKMAEYLYSHCGHLTAENAADELPTLLKIAAAIFNIDLNDFTGESNLMLPTGVSAVAFDVYGRRRSMPPTLTLP